MKKMIRAMALMLLAAMLLSGCQSADSTITQPEVTAPASVNQPVFPMDAQLDEDIIKGFCALMEEDYDKIGSQLSVRYYWRDENAYVVYIDGYREYEDTATSFILSSKEFLFPTAQPLFIYKCGIFYRLSSNNIHVLNLDAFYSYHIEQYAELYNSQRTYEKKAINCPAFLNEEKRTELECALGLDAYSCTDSLWYTEDSPTAMCRYYGSYNGYDIIFCEYEADTEEWARVEVGGIAFDHAKPFRLYAYKSGVLADLEEVYAEGSISEEALEKVYESYIQCMKKYLDWADKFESVDARILKLFCSLTEEDYDEIGEQLSVKPYWESEEFLAVYIEGYSEDEETVTSVFYGGRAFLFPTGQPIYLYLKNQDMIYPFNWWSCNSLSEDALSKFYEYNKEQNADLYNPENAYKKTQLYCPALLTADKRAEIEQALGQDEYISDDSLWYREDCPISIYRYYGSDNGYDIIFCDSESGAAVTETKVIDDVTFHHAMPFVLYAYKDGVFANLEEVYEEGLISKDALEKAGEYHASCEESYYVWIDKINNQ